MDKSIGESLIKISIPALTVLSSVSIVVVTAIILVLTLLVFHLNVLILFVRVFIFPSPLSLALVVLVILAILILVIGLPVVSSSIVVVSSFLRLLAALSLRLVSFLVDLHISAQL